MAGSDTRATDSLPIGSLGAKYADLAAKYAQLMERVDQRATLDLDIFRLGTWGLQAASAALAVVESGHIALANARFTSMARSLAGPLICIDPEPGKSHPGLRALATAEAAPLIKARQSARELRYRDAGSNAVLSIHLERTGRARHAPVLLIAEDVTEHARHDSELEHSREALLRRERLRVLGELAASIAHDLGNTLRGTSFQLAMLEDPALSADKRADALRGIAARIEIASAVISRLHDFARTGLLKTAAVQLQRIVSQAVAIMETELRDGEPVKVRVSIPDLPQVHGSAPELSLLFVNLLRNARQAMPAGGTISIAARRRRDSVVVTVSDQGTGIPADVRARLFEPFFTTRGAQGTGLGLWLAAGTMARLGGTIRAVHRPRSGALFSLIFPVVEAIPGSRRRAASRRKRRGPRSGRRT
ncbi:MAG: sensor histidine kinase [Deltaproteobacteria bacterium]